jgi:hypothetical protein
MNCNICHHPNDDDNSYCENCGIKLLPSATGEVWRARDVVSYYSEGLFIPFDISKGLLICIVLSAILSLVEITVLALPIKFTALSLIFFAAFFVNFFKQRRKTLKSLSLIDRNKTVIAHGSAELIGAAAGIGGWLYLMEDALIFTPESYFINSPLITLSFDRLRSKSTDIGFNPTGDKFQITMSDGQEFLFSVSRREIWLKLIDERLFETVKATQAR